MNAWYEVLDESANGLDGTLLVTVWNDQVMVVARDKQGEVVLQLWLSADETDGIRAVMREVHGPEGEE